MRSTTFVLPLLALAAAFGADLRTGHYAGRRVVFENVNGVAVYQGDIILGATSDIEQPPAETRAKAGKEATTVSSTRYLWPNGRIPYVLDSGFSDRQRQVILQAIDHWNTRTPIRLYERASETNYVRFSTSNNPIACSSNVGMIGGMQRISLPEGCGVGATIHEIGHAVGLWHEQSRNDRNRYLTVLYENIDKPNGAQFDQTFDDGIDAGPYDLGSIMHYGAFDFSKDGLQPAMETVPAGIPMGQRTGLSSGDIDAVRRLYGESVVRTVVATVPAGLKLRVDGVLVDDGTAFDWAPGSRHTIEAPFQGSDQTRYLFGNWSDGGDLAHTVTAAAERTLYIATFIRQHRIQAAVTGAGTVRFEPQSPDGFYTERSSIYIQAMPAAGNTFLEWSVRPSRSLNPKSMTVSGPTTVQATFVPGPVTTITSNPIGRIIVVDGTQYSTPANFAWGRGERHTLSIDSTQEDFVRHRFTGWSDGGAQTHTITATGNSATYTASYVTQYSLTTQLLGARSASITASPASSDGYYDEGTAVQLTATAPLTSTFYAWSGDVRGSANPATVVMDDQKLVTASFMSRLPAITVINAATGDEDYIVPGQIVSVFGKNIGPATSAGLQLANGRVTTQLGGAEVLFDGQPAPLTYASQGQLNAVVPYGIASRSFTTVQVRYAGQVTQGVTIPVADSAPGIFSADSTGRGQGAVLNENGTLNSPSNPARRGSVVVLYATGEGATSPAGVDGQVAAQIYPKPVLPVSVRIGGQPAVVHYAGAAPGFVAGLMQINAQVPDSVPVGARVPVSVVVGSASSSPGVTIAIQ